jgi:RHS repeat-associated protein
MPTLQRSGKRMAHGSAPLGANGTPAMDTVPAQRPADPAARVGDGVKEIAGDARTVAQVASAFANPEGFLLGKVAEQMDDKLADLTNSISAMLPCFPAATLTSLALGAPHAHVAHPPSGPPPVPPTPLPPTGPVLLGTCLQVLINNKPAARCGDIGLNPTCCGLPPMFEVFTGSSKVFIGGARAARAGIDITMHCKSSAGGDRAAAMSAKIANVAAKVASVAAKISQVAAIAGEAAEASEASAEDDAAMAAAHGLNASMMAAQMAADAAAMAAAAAMGKDPCVPPTGTPGMILAGSPDVLIGGLPLPSSMAIAQGLMKKLKGLRFRRGGRRPPSQNKDCGNHLLPINLVTGACVEEYVDYEEREPLPFLWKRYYDSRWTQQPGPFGWGFRHEYQRELTRTLDGLQYRNQEGDTVLFPAVDEEGQSAAADGLSLTCSQVQRYLVREQSQPTMEFTFASDEQRAVLQALHWVNGSLYFAYDPHRRLSVLRDSSGGKIRLHYNRTDQIIQVTRARPGETNELRLASYTYDRAGCLNEFVDALGARATYAYDSTGRKTRYTDRRGYAVFNEYDEQGRCVREYCQDGLFDGKVEYLPEARCAIVTHASDGATATVFFDENQVLREYITPSGGKIEFVTDEQGRVTEERDALGNVTKVLYNGWGGNIGRQDPLGYIHPPSHLDPNPPDPLAYQLPETPLEWELGELINGYEITGKPSRGNLRSLDWLPATVVNAVLQLNSEPNDVSTHETDEPRKIHDALSRIIEERDADGYHQRWKYDAEGNVLEYMDRDGAVQRYVYKSWNLLDQEINPVGAVIRYDYSSRAEITRVVDGGGTTHEYAYDQWDRLVEVSRHGRVKERYRYDLADNLIEKTDGQGRTLLAFEIAPGNLDAVRRLSSGENHYFDYDTRGRIIRAATDELENTFAYDGMGRKLADKRDGLGIERDFAVPGLVRTIYLNQFRVERCRSSEELVTLRDPTGQLHRLRFGKDGVFVCELASGTNQVMRFNRRGQCLYKAAVPRDSATPTWEMCYHYSAEGDLSVAEGTNGTTRYEYDLAHRLVREILPTGQEREFVRDLADNLIRQPGLGDVSLLEGNRLAEANGDRFTYNERNHVSARHSPRISLEFKYDSLDRLVGCTINGERWTARYDSLGRLVSKTWRGRRTSYYWDDFRLATEVRPNGSFRLYLYVDEKALVPFMFVEYESLGVDPANGKSFFLFTNQIGVPVRAEDINGREAWQARVDPYGLVHVRPGNRIDMPLRFPGHYYIAEIGLHFNRFRYYSPELARYIQSDPLGIEGGINLYGYCSNPLTRVDIDGLAHPKQRRNRKNAKTEGVSKKPAPPNKKEPIIVPNADRLRSISAKSRDPQKGFTRAVTVKNGTLMEKGKPLENGRHDYVITEGGELKIGGGHFHLSNGADSVKAAGQIYTENGKIQVVNTESGHYQPTNGDAQRSAAVLRDAGLADPGVDVMGR